jgi:hypothetical protein
VEFGKANLVQKAREQPDKVKHVLDKIGMDGLFRTLEAPLSGGMRFFCWGTSVK